MNCAVRPNRCGQVLAQGADAEPFGGVVPGREGRWMARLPRNVHHPFADPPRSGRRRALPRSPGKPRAGRRRSPGRACAPRPGRGGRRAAPGRRSTPCGLQLGGGKRLRKLPLAPHRQPLMEGEGGDLFEPEGARRERVVCRAPGGVEGEMVGQQVDLAADELGHPPVTGNRSGRAASLPRTDRDGPGWRRPAPRGRGGRAPRRPKPR